jgi:hypothetical protein
MLKCIFKPAWYRTLESIIIFTVTRVQHLVSVYECGVGHTVSVAWVTLYECGVGHTVSVTWVTL